ncbi:MAG: hypothetical protein Q8Q81_02565 [Oxalobacteraceae bacterium]|nr:hypothetical protein [Oxalobacteraceae bacterium]
MYDTRLLCNNFIRPALACVHRKAYHRGLVLQILAGTARSRKMREKRWEKCITSLAGFGCLAGKLALKAIIGLPDDWILKGYRWFICR